MSEPLVAVILGSESDQEMMAPCLEVFKMLKVPYELSVLSYHRHRAKLDEYLSELPTTAVRVVIAAAGMAAQLPGIVAAYLKNLGIPVVGVALSSKGFPDAQDALLSIVRLPGGVPLVCAGIDQDGAKNAALFAANILVASKLVDLIELLSLYKKFNTDKPAQLRSEVWSPESV